MDLNIIRNNKNIEDVIVRKNNIFEISLAENDKGLVYDISVYDPYKNTLKTIDPDTVKFEAVPVFNCIWGSDKLYYATLEEKTDYEREIRIYQYDNSSASTVEILTINGRSLIIKGYKSIKIFILTENQILVQTEHKKDWQSMMMMGNIEFAQTLYNIDTGETMVVNDINLINNGINMILPVSDTNILLKTGFSYLEDDRLNGSSEDEALIESIYYGGMSMFISSLSKESSTMGFNMLATAYYNKCILMPAIRDDYIYFSVYDKENKTIEAYFHNYISNNTIRGMTSNVDYNNMNCACVISNIPYVRNKENQTYKFFNLLTSETDCVFFEEKFENIVGPFIVFSTVLKGKNHIRAYRFPKLDLILDETGYFNCAFYEDNAAYIYVSKYPKSSK